MGETRGIKGGSGRARERDGGRRGGGACRLVSSRSEVILREYLPGNSMRAYRTRTFFLETGDVVFRNVIISDTCRHNKRDDKVLLGNISLETIQIHFFECLYRLVGI